MPYIVKWKDGPKMHWTGEFFTPQTRELKASQFTAKWVAEDAIATDQRFFLGAFDVERHNYEIIEVDPPTMRHP